MFPEVSTTVVNTRRENSAPSYGFLKSQSNYLRLNVREDIQYKVGQMRLVWLLIL